MNLIIGIYLLSAISAKQDSISPVYFYKTQSCHIGYVTTYNMKLDLSCKDYFVFTTLSEKKTPYGIQKQKPSVSSVTGKWQYENGVLTLYPINFQADNRGLYTFTLQFKADMFCIKSLKQDESIYRFPDFMASLVAPHL